MASAAQATANAANAQKSTGPRTEEGKANSSKNSITHGLNSEPSTLFAHSPELAKQFEEFCSQFELDAPQCPHEQLYFDRWTYAAFQAVRARALEAMAESDLRAHFGQIEYERRWQRFVQTRQRLEREGEAALAKMLELQNLRDEREEAKVEAAREETLRQRKIDFNRAINPAPPPIRFGDYVSMLCSDNPEYQASFDRLTQRYPLGAEAKPDDTWEVKIDRAEQWIRKFRGQESRLSECYF
jgi:hypothetical protein